MLGVVNLDKPVGPTSHDMVVLLRRLTGMRRIGHAGTLDPLASGVLPVLVGGATRFSEELSRGRKRYDAVIRLGARSVTDDAQGPIEAGEGPLPDEAKVGEALARFIGTFEQRPPAFSARKRDGQTAHRAARRGSPLDLPARTVTVDGLEVLGVEPAEGWVDVRVDLRCGPGTYVRSIARDVGEALGCGGYLRALQRTEAAGLTLAGSLPPEELERLASEGRLDDALLPLGPLLPLPAVSLDPHAAGRFGHGMDVPVGESGGDGEAAVFDGAELIGVGRISGGTLRPRKVLARGASG